MNFHAADLNDIEALLREYDNLVHRATTDNMLGLVDDITKEHTATHTVLF